MSSKISASLADLSRFERSGRTGAGSGTSVVVKSRTDIGNSTGSYAERGCTEGSSSEEEQRGVT